MEQHCLELNVIPWLLLALYNFGFMVLCLQYTMYGQTFLCFCTEISRVGVLEGVLHRDVLVQWKYRTGFDKGGSGTSIKMLILPDLYLHCQTLLKINNIAGQHTVLGQEHQEQRTQDSFVSLYLPDTEGQVNCLFPSQNLVNILGC